jgi:CAAX prenyl protease-like protein
MAAFLLLTAAEGYVPKAGSQPHPTWYPVAYAAKIAIVAAVAFACRSTWRDLRPRPRPVAWLASVGIGLLVTALWVGLDPFYPRFGALGTRAAFDPGTLPTATRGLFLASRFFGLVLVVPLIEELFWRSFLLRWIINPDFSQVPIGRVTPMAAAATSALFALAHPEWLPALLTGLLWAGLLAWSKSLSACVVSHATANLGLGLYVLATGEWKYL